MKFERLALIGCGLMGGSFALALRQAGSVAHVAGFSASEGTRQKALKLGVIDSVCSSAAEAVRGADLVLVAVPVSATGSTLQAIDEVRISRRGAQASLALDELQPGPLRVR